jgi:hypothetical protein
MSEKEEAPKKLFLRSCIEGIQLPHNQVLSIYLSKFGKVVKIIDGNKGRTFAFVTFLTAEQAKAAFDAINGSKGGDASTGVNLGRTLFVDFAVEEGAKPVHVKAPKPDPARVSSPLETPKLAPSPGPAPLETPKPAPAPRPALAQIPSLPQVAVLDVASANLPMVYISVSQRAKIMSKPAMAFLFFLGLSPQTKFQGDIPVQMFGNGDEWVIPHPEHPTATQDCQKAYDSGKYSKKITVNIPKEVLTSKKFWRD